MASAQLVVTTAIDEDDGDALPAHGTGTSLREAANYASPDDTILFDPLLSGQTLSVTNGQIVINKSLAIDASAVPDGVVIDGHGQNRLLRCTSNTRCTLTALILKGGRTPSDGGAILNDSELTLNECTLRGNRANEGGAIFQFEDATLNNCTIVSNSARFGGGIENDGGTLVLNNSTVVGNTATNEGGGILNLFTTTLNHCTVVGNRAGIGEVPGFGGGIGNCDTLHLNNSIVAANTAGIEPNIGGTIDSTSGINITSGDPLLAPLGDHGGPTDTMLPLTGSPAIDPVGGDTTSVFLTDQHGFTRVVNGVVDVGATEVQEPAGAPVQITATVLLGNGAFQLSFNNSTGASFQVLASTNLGLPSPDWPVIGAATETPAGSGQFEFTDQQAAGLPLRFYRVDTP